MAVDSLDVKTQVGKQLSTNRTYFGQQPWDELEQRWNEQKLYDSSSIQEQADTWWNIAVFKKLSFNPVKNMPDTHNKWYWDIEISVKIN